jgi:predicted Fe-Mo cluster-binding NifX family protein
MKIAVSSSGQNLGSPIDPRFGRCAYFLIVETDDMSFNAFVNESETLRGGAGIQSAQFVASKGAKAVITGNCGPNAIKTLSAAGVRVFLRVTGSILEAVEKYKSGSLPSVGKADVSARIGLSDKNEVEMQRQQAPGDKKGLGRGMGMGRRQGT